MRGHAQLAMGFVGIAMKAQGGDMGVSDIDLGDLFAGEIGWEPALPKLVFAFDFAFGLRRWGRQEAKSVYENDWRGRARLLPSRPIGSLPLSLRLGRSRALPRQAFPYTL